MMFAGVPPQGLVLLLGPPGSGKTTFAALAFPEDEVIASDDVRRLIGGRSNALWATDASFRIIEDSVAVRLGMGHRTIVDFTGTRLDVVERLRAVAVAASQPVTAIHVNTPLDRCLTQNSSRGTAAVPEDAVRQMSRKIDETIAALSVARVPILALSDMRSVPAGRQVFLAMPVTENLGDAGFRSDKRTFYQSVHAALGLVGFDVASAAVNEDYGRVQLQPAAFTRYDVDRIAACDCLLVTTTTSASPDIYLEIGLAVGAGKPVGLVLPVRGRLAAMMRGMVELGEVRLVHASEDRDVPHLAARLAWELAGRP